MCNILHYYVLYNLRMFYIYVTYTYMIQDTTYVIQYTKHTRTYYIAFIYISCIVNTCYGIHNIFCFINYII